MNEEQLQEIERRRVHADGMNITNAIHDSDACTHADYTFVEWVLEDVPALIAEVRSLSAKLDAVPIDAIRAIYDSVPVSNWTRKPLAEIRKWLAARGKQVSL